MKKFKIVEEQAALLSDIVVYAFNRMSESKSLSTSSYLKAVTEELSKSENEYEIVKPDSDIITIGSKFNATIDFYGQETNNYILSELDIPVKGYIVITPAAPIAKAVMGKSINDTFSYDVNSHIINGKVNKIIREKQKTIK